MDRTVGQCGGREPVEEPTLVGVRDMIVDCFTATHGQKFGETRAILGLDDAEHAVRGSMLGIVRLAYTIAGGNFDTPTLDTTIKVVNMLAERSVHWGAPLDDVFEHHCALMRQLGLIHLRYGDIG